MKTIKVVAAVICDPPDKKQKIFATARGYGEFKGQWEFPGGKVEPGETSQQALVREIQEELATKIWCEVVEGELKLLEAEDARWLTKDKLYSVKWLPADVTLIAEIEKSME